VVDVEWIAPRATLTGEPAVDEIPPVALLSLPAQVADKVCALFERYGSGKFASSRARDLADIAIIASQKSIGGTELTNEVRREERRRLEAQTLAEPLPAALRLADEQISDWGSRWHKATRAAPIDFDQAQAVAAAFMDPVLKGTVEGKQWSPAEQYWR